MAPLPNMRVSQPFCTFAHISMYYGGPFTVQGLGKRQQKRWLCLFMCLSSQAVHLERPQMIIIIEMTKGLDTNSFLKCFIQMTSSREQRSIGITSGTSFYVFLHNVRGSLYRPLLSTTGHSNETLQEAVGVIVLYCVV